MAFNNSAFLAAQRGFHEDKQIKASIGLLIVKYPDGEQLCQPPKGPAPGTVQLGDAEKTVGLWDAAVAFSRGLFDGLRGR